MANIELNKENLDNLSKILGVAITDVEIIKESLTHRSFRSEQKDVKFNERLEFVGDAVLELVSTEFLFTKLEDENEGQLTSLRAALVKTESLAEESRRLQIGEFILMSSGEENTGGRDREYILANTMEALIGGLYLMSGYEKAKDFILKNICYKIDRIIEEGSAIDAKSKLQEISQERLKITPSYSLISSSGPDHSKTFEMGMYIEKTLFGKGKGKSKQEAEQAAAAQSLKNWEELEKKFLKKR